MLRWCFYNDTSGIKYELQHTKLPTLQTVHRHLFGHARVTFSSAKICRSNLVNEVNCSENGMSKVN